MSYPSLAFLWKDDEELPQGVENDLFHRNNFALAMSYLSVGLTMSLMSTPLNIYMVETLNAEPEVQSTVYILSSLPWSLKILFGFISDAFPIMGYHRKPYLTIGAVIYSAAYILYAVIGYHDVRILSLCTFLGTLGLIQMDVMADTMCVERSKFEVDDRKGQMQASCYSIRFAGSLIGAILGTSVCNQSTWGWGLTYAQVSCINGLIPFVLVTPWLYLLRERYPRKWSPRISNIAVNSTGDGDSSLLSTAYKQIEMKETSSDGNSVGMATKLLHQGPSRSYGDEESSAAAAHSSSSSSGDDDEDLSIGRQLQEIWGTVQLRAVWRPMAFVYIFNLFQIPNVAWQSFLQLSLRFEPWILGLTVTLGSFMTFAGILAYKYLFFKTSWRRIYVWSVGLTTFFSLLQMCLIFQINKTWFHMNNYLFSLGDDVITSYINGIQFLPVCIMYTRLCPEGAEGSSYSMLTTFGNIALVCASNVGNLLAGVWNVSNDAMRRNDVSGLWRLTLLTSMLSVVPLSLLFLLPRSAEEQDQLSRSKVRSKLGGAIFLVVLFSSILWTICTAVYRLVVLNV